jgi:hypothetical protein
MNTDNVTSIDAGKKPRRPNDPAKRRAPRTSGSVKAIEERAEQIRDLVFEAQSIIDVSRAAIGSDTPAGEWGSQKALQIALGLLDDAAGQLEPGAITQTGVFHG